MTQSLLVRLKPHIVTYGLARDNLSWNMPPVDYQGVHIAGVSTQGIQWLIDSLAAYPPSHCWLLTKGLHVTEDGIYTLPEYMAKCLPQWSFGVIYGPALAHDVATSQSLIALSVASDQGYTLDFIDTSYCVLQVTQDVSTICFLAALKNIYAIIIGYAGYYGISAQSIVLTAVCRELCRIIISYGGDPQLVYSYAGLADMTATALQGRNARFGHFLAQGHTPEDIMKVWMSGHTVEGYILSMQLLAHQECVSRLKSCNAFLMLWLLEGLSTHALEYDALVEILSRDEIQ